MDNNKKKKNGFSLIELLIVISIIGILLTNISSSISSARAKARDAKRLSDVKTIQTALEIYYTENGHYPKAITSSNRQDWNTNLGTKLGIKMPKDPINTLSHPVYNTNATRQAALWTGNYVYTYFSSENVEYCANQAYVIYFRSELEFDEEPSQIIFCNGERYYRGAFSTGVGSDGRFFPPKIK